ncbi:hypothetical protein MHYP_G00127470 [Metynnis hypsauchen]
MPKASDPQWVCVLVSAPQGHLTNQSIHTLLIGLAWLDWTPRNPRGWSALAEVLIAAHLIFLLYADATLVSEVELGVFGQGLRGGTRRQAVRKQWSKQCTEAVHRGSAAEPAQGTVVHERRPDDENTTEGYRPEPA